MYSKYPQDQDFTNETFLSKNSTCIAKNLNFRTIVTQYLLGVGSVSKRSSMSKRFSNPCLKLVRNVEFDCWSIGVDRSMGWDKPSVTNKVKTKRSLIILSPNSITCSLFSSLLRNGETTGCYDCIYSQKVRRSVAS